MVQGFGGLVGRVWEFSVSGFRSLVLRVQGAGL